MSVTVSHVEVSRIEIVSQIENVSYLEKLIVIAVSVTDIILESVRNR